MDWFERLTGFKEGPFRATQSRLEVRDQLLCSRVNGRCYGIGSLELPTLRDLRAATRGKLGNGRLRVSSASGDVGGMHRLPQNEGALFQVASQFNLLEMIGPEVTPEDGVTRYQRDLTQGPACAMAAGAATIYRNYFAPVRDQIGQTAKFQLDAAADLRNALAQRVGTEANSIWEVRNGYALAYRNGLDQVNGWLRQATSAEIDEIRETLRIGLHVDVEVTDADASPGPIVSQAFCSAMPVSYSSVDPDAWAPVAKLVLESAYEATLHAAVLQAARGRSSRVLLTQLGGGAFGNEEHWIDGAIRRALRLFAKTDLEVVLVSFGAPSQATVQLVRDFSA